MTTRTDLLTPAGRLVMGSLYKPNTTDAEGKPLVVKSGPNTGQARQDYYFALAIPKGTEQHWAQTPWGAIIYRTGQTDFPQAHQAPTFAWKVKDGNSQVPNRRGKKPCDQEGFPGHWVVSFSSGYPPKISRDNGTVPILEADAVNLGDWVQVFGSCGGNGSQTQPGVFVNHSMVNFVGFGKRIVVGPDAASVGFGQGVVLPPGVSATPPSGTWAPAAVLPGAPDTLPLPATFFPAIATPALPPVVVAPNPAFLMPAPPPAAPALPVMRQMTAKARGATYESFIAQNWNDQLLVQHGYMIA
jgi:hypothetical protein